MSVKDCVASLRLTTDSLHRLLEVVTGTLKLLEAELKKEAENARLEK